MTDAELVEALRDVCGQSDTLRDEAADRIEELSRALREKDEALLTVQHNRECSCYRMKYVSGPCDRCKVGYDAVDRALSTGSAGQEGK